MRILKLEYRNLALQIINFSAGHMARPLDRVRIAMLRVTMKSEWLRQIYCNRAYRLGMNYLFLFTIYLWLSLQWSMALLVLGPLILGYPHLIASYRFLQKSSAGLNLRWNSALVIRIFLILTAISLFIRFGVSEIEGMPQVPYGTWEILLSLFAVGIVGLKIGSLRHVLIAAMTLAMVGGILKLAWWNPLAFVGFALIFHNWVAFGHWIFAAKDNQNRVVAVLATLLFAWIHVYIFAGYLDSLISFPDFKFLSTQSLEVKSFEVKGWALASWSNETKMWDRAIVVYAFGLSMHYFIWLRAIPQCLDKKSVPNSFRRSLELLRQDCGPTVTTFLFAGAIAALGMWFFTPYAGRIYFGIAMLHGWLELIFLIFGISSAVLKTN
jgi:hypothetical protein